MSFDFGKFRRLILGPDVSLPNSVLCSSSASPDKCWDSTCHIPFCAQFNLQDTLYLFLCCPVFPGYFCCFFKFQQQIISLNTNLTCRLIAFNSQQNESTTVQLVYVFQRDMRCAATRFDRAHPHLYCLIISSQTQTDPTQPIKFMKHC